MGAGNGKYCKRLCHLMDFLIPAHWPEQPVNIKAGAVSPLSGIAKFAFKLLMAAFLATYLEQVPMACIGGILLYVANGMVEIKEIGKCLNQKVLIIFCF